MDFSLLAQVAGSTGVLLAVFKIVEYLIKRVAERRADRANVEHRNAETANVTTDARVTESADYRQWAEKADARAEAAAAKADARVERAEAAAEKAREEAAECRKAMWRAEDAAAGCRREVDELRDAIRDCARPGCPIRPRVVGTLEDGR